MPPTTSLVAPPGRPIFAAKAFVPPDAKLSPLFRNEDGDGERRDSPSSPREAEYAGKGNYF